MNGRRREGVERGSEGAPLGELSHLDERGRASMVDVGAKDETERVARAEAAVVMAPETLAIVVDAAVPKGDVVAAARLAGIMAAKRTHELIPLCHQLNLTKVAVEIEADESLPGLRIVTEARLRGRTGVEMEALVAASVAALTVYDMCKAVDRGMEVTGVRLLEKSGGRSGHWRREGAGDADAPAGAAGVSGAAQ
jgi:cyclic pyranopterin phosphate synthase